MIETIARLASVRQICRGLVKGTDALHQAFFSGYWRLDGGCWILDTRSVAFSGRYSVVGMWNAAEHAHEDEGMPPYAVRLEAC